MGLRCFVAMAFFRNDTEKVYDKIIAPTLRDKGVTPIRVDRIDCNEDIDNLIISELQKCDFAIADLTYARPSVYFEAGFAQRNVPVIYTCRKDHFTPRANDTFGNFRIHFDLQMKNIIPWSSPSDSKFIERLAKRITRIIAPILRNKETEQIEMHEAKKFDALSLQEKTKQILSVCIEQLKRARFRETTCDYGALSQSLSLFFRRMDQERFFRFLSFNPKWLGMKLVNGGIHEVFVYVTSTLTRTKLIDLDKILFTYPIYDINPGLKTGKLQKLIEHIFICSLQRTPISRVKTSLPNFSLDHRSNELIWTGSQTVPRKEIPGYNEVYVVPRGFLLQNLQRNISDRPKAVYDINDDNVIVDRYHGKKWGRVKQIPRSIHVCILDSIKFERHFEKVFTDKLRRIESNCI